MKRFLNDISKVWIDLSEDTQKDLSKLIVGQRNANNFEILMK